MAWVQVDGHGWRPRADTGIGRQFGWRHEMGWKEGGEIGIESEPRDRIMGEESFAGIEGV